MSSHYLRIRNIPEGSLLRLLAKFVSGEPKYGYLLHPALLDVQSVDRQHEFAQATTGTFVTLYIPYDKSKDQPGIDHLERLSRTPDFAVTTATIGPQQVPTALLVLKRWLPNFLFGQTPGEAENGSNGNDLHPPADSIDDEKVLVLLPDAVHKMGQGLREHIAEIFHDLRTYGLSVHWTGGRVQPAGTDRGAAAPDDSPLSVEKNLYIFHVKDKSNQGIVQHTFNGTSTYLGCHVMDCYHTSVSSERLHQRLAVSPGMELDKDRLLDLGTILNHVPDLFNVPSLPASGETFPQEPRGDLLAIIRRPTPDDDDGHPITISTALLEFAAGEYQAKTWEFVEFVPLRVQPIAHSKQALHDHLDAIARDVYPDRLLNPYHLELRATHYQDVHEAQYEELQYRFHEIQDRLIELANFGKKRPRLYRFTKEQVPALVDVIRSFPLQQISALHYAFCVAPDGNPSTLSQRFEAGVHYLYVDKEGALSGLDPMVWWAGKTNLPMEFWLDPYWCQHLEQDEWGSGPAVDRKMELFVPHGTHLYPTVSAWEPAQMDEVLNSLVQDSREKTLEQLLKNTPPGEAKPSAALTTLMARSSASAAGLTDTILIIERDPETPADLYLTAVSKADFVRLAPPPQKSATRAPQASARADQSTAREPVSSFSVSDLFRWLNSYLYWYDTWRDKEVIKGLTATLDHLRQDEVAKKVAQMAASHNPEFDRLKQKLTQEAHTLTQGFGNEIAAHLSKIADETSAAMSEAHELNRKVRTYKSLYAQTRRLVDKTTSTLDATENASQDLEETLRSQRDTIDNAIKSARQARAEQEKLIRDEIKEVQDRRNDLDREIHTRLSERLSQLGSPERGVAPALYQPQFSAVYPAEIAPEQWNTLYVYAFLTGASRAAHADAAQHLPVKSPPRSAARLAQDSIPVGAALTATPRIPGFEFNPPALTLRFYEDWHRFDFRMQAVDVSLNTSQIGTITISSPDTGALIADLPVMVRVSYATHQVTYLTSEAALFQNVFCSYSPADSLIAKHTEDYYKTLHITNLHDLTALAGNQRGTSARQPLIAQADVFQLFWSENASASAEVIAEWTYARQLIAQNKKPATFIRPVCWVDPPTPTPPPELQHLHFACFPALGRLTGNAGHVEP